MEEASQRVLREVERRKLAQALADTAGDRARMCELLQMTPGVLAARLRECGLS
jgi:DNA-binding NtrC family response regulator